MSACRLACHRNNFWKSRVSDVSARILAMMSVSVSVSASWNSSFTAGSWTLRPSSRSSDAVTMAPPSHPHSYAGRRLLVQRVCCRQRPTCTTRAPARIQGRPHQHRSLQASSPCCCNSSQIHTHTHTPCCLSHLSRTLAINIAVTSVSAIELSAIYEYKHIRSRVR